MIKANELRIGNLVNANYDSPFRIKEISPAGVDEDNLPYDYVLCDEREVIKRLMNQINPIPLTPELLEKCGFKNGKLDNFYFLRSGDLTIQGHVADYNGLYIGSVNFLHQLQNLYFALTGEELQVRSSND